MAEKRYFSLGEAQRLLPRVRLGLQRLAELQEAMDFIAGIEVRYEDEMEDLLKDIETNKNFHRLYLRYFEELERLVKLGVIVKDPRTGLADFYALHEGREIFLCYRLGEDKIRHWHYVEEGFKGRRPVSLLKVEQEKED